MTYRYWRVLSEWAYTHCPRCGSHLDVVGLRLDRRFNGINGKLETVYSANVQCPKRSHSLIEFLRSLAGYNGHHSGSLFVVPAKGPGHRVLWERVK